MACLLLYVSHQQMVSINPVVFYVQGTGEKEKEITDCKLIVQNVIYGMKTLLFSILYCTRQISGAQQQQQQHPPGQPGALPQQQQPANVGMHEEDVRTCARLLVNGLHSLKVGSFFR